MSMGTEMRRLAVLADIAARLGHRVVTEVEQPKGHCGPVNFGLDAGGAYVELFGQRMSEDDARTLVANLLNAVDQSHYLGWIQEHSRKDPRVNHPEG